MELLVELEPESGGDAGETERLGRRLQQGLGSRDAAEVAREVTPSIDGESFELGAATPAERAELIDPCALRHQQA